MRIGRLRCRVDRAEPSSPRSAIVRSSFAERFIGSPSSQAFVSTLRPRSLAAHASVVTSIMRSHHEPRANRS